MSQFGITFIHLLKGTIMTEATPKTPKKAAAKAEPATTKTVTKKPVSKAVAKKPTAAVESKTAVEKKPAAAKKPAATKAVAPRKTAEKKPSTSVKAKTLSNEQRYRMIAEAAYYRAESRQFMSDPLRDWIEAEQDISILLSETE